MANCDTTVIEVGSCTTGNVVDNENGTHTFYPGDGTSVTFPTLYLDSVTFNTTTRVLTLTMSEGTDYTVTIPPAPDITNNLDNTYTITYPDGTEFDIDTNDVVTVLLDNGDGTIIYTDEDGIETNIDICDILQYCEINSFGNVNATPDASNVFLVYNSGTGDWEEGKANFVTISDQTGSTYDHDSLPSAPSAPPANPNINDVIIEVFANGQIYWVWAGATWNRYYESYPTQSPTFTGTASLNAGVVTNDFQVSGDLIVDTIRPDIDGAAAIVIADQSGVPFLTFNTNGQKILYTGMGSTTGVAIGPVGTMSNLGSSVVIGQALVGGQLSNGVADALDVVIGPGAAGSTNIGLYSIFIGKDAGYNVTTPSTLGNYSTVVGAYALSTINSINNFSNFSIFGARGGINAVDVSNSVLLGYSAGEAADIPQSVAIGFNAGKNSVAEYSVFIGRDTATDYNGTLGQSIGIGSNSLRSSQGNYTTFVGHESGYYNPSAYTVGIGYHAGEHDAATILTHESYASVFIGANAGFKADTYLSVGIGYDAMDEAVARDRSIAIGASSAAGATSFNRSTAIGSNSGFQTDSDFSVMVGEEAGRQSTGDRSVYLGAYQGKNSVTGNELLIGAYEGISIIEGALSSNVVNQVLTFHADTNVDYDFVVATDLFVVDTTNELITINASNGSGNNMMELTSSYANVRLLGAGTSYLRLERNQNGTGAYGLYFTKRRGTITVPADIVNGDTLGEILFGARYNGGVEADFASITAVSGTGGNREGILNFNVANGGGTLTKMRLNQDGYLAVGQSIADSTSRLLVSANYSGDPVGINGSCIGLFTRQNSGAYIAVNSSTTARASIYLGDIDDISAGGFTYNNSIGDLNLFSENSISISTNLALGTTFTDPLVALHINYGAFSSSPTGINTAQVGLLLTRQTSTIGLAINAGTANEAYIYFGDEDDVDASSITHDNSTGDLTIAAETNINLDSIVDYTVAMGDSTLDPTTDAPVDWLEVQIAGTTYYVPVYAAS